MTTTIQCLNSHLGDRFAIYHGDCVDVVRQLPDAAIGFSVFSPPFSNLFTYSDSVADMGNCKDDEEFFTHYRFLVSQLRRVTKPGRLCAVHCSELPSSKWKDGFIGLRDFPGEVIRTHQDAGWIYHSRITVWRCPVVEMTRTKALGLLHKQIKKDSSMSRAGLADTVVVFRAPGENIEPISHTAEEFPVEQWQKWASPVWMDIDQSDTLNVAAAKDQQDERHVCPLQLGLIERALILWSNPGDVVLSPFAGVGSEGVVALRTGRRFVGVELKESYYRSAVGNIDAIDRQTDLFPGVG